MKGRVAKSWLTRPSMQQGFLAGSSFEKAGKRHGEPEGRLCQQESTGEL